MPFSPAALTVPVMELGISSGRIAFKKTHAQVEWLD
jgi:hypothetical protein